MNNRFSAGLAKIKAEGRPAPPPSSPTSPQPVAASQLVPPSRRGKKAIAAYFDPAVRKQLAILAAQEERTQADLLAEAINLLFEKYGQSPIAKA
jgi:hypothetical protein